MSAEAHVPKISSVLAERVAFSLAALLLLASFVTAAVHWDWLLDTAFLLAAGFLAFRAPAEMEDGATLPLLLATYLLLDSAFELLVAFVFPGWQIVAAAVLAGCYLISVKARLRQAGYSLPEGPFAALLHGPSLGLTLALAVPLVCLFLPMLHARYAFQAWSGPMVIHLPGTVHMDAGRTLQLQGDVLVRGVQVSFSRLVGLLLLGALAGHFARLQGWIAAGSLRIFLRCAGVLAALWWLTLAHGLQSLQEPANLLFAAGVVLLLVTAFARPAKPVG